MSEARLGHFRIIEEIGRGGMGAVYRALDERLERLVALKVLRPSPGAGADAFKRLIHEAKAAARIEHPNIATIYELGEESGAPFIAMELVKGETLRQRLARGPLSPREAVEVASQVCRGLEAAHGLGVVHRDVKPENIAVSEDGAVKILDFGVAILRSRMGLQGAADSEEITKTLHLAASSWIAGTVPYMSPEQLAGASVDGRSDLFSLGIVVYELVSGERPFRGHTSEKLAEAILHEDPPSLSDSSSPVDRELAAIVRKCLAKNPADRFQSAGELARALKEWLEPVPTWHRGWFRNALAATLVVAGCMGGWIAWRSYRTAVPSAGEVFTIGVAPFASVTGAGQERGRAYQGLVEREIRRRVGEAPVRILEGELHEPIESESQAREVGQRLGADAVCWGKLLGVGQEEEMEARITPIRRIEQAAVGSVEVSLTSDPQALLELVRRIPLDGPGQIGMLASKAEEVADLVSTLVGLAQIRAGQYEEASRTLAALKAPTPDQRFYQGLARLRANDRTAAEALFHQVLAEDPKHSGARLGILVSRGADSSHSAALWDEQSITLTLDGLANDPVDPELNTVLFSELLHACLTGNQSCQKIAVKVREHFLALCDRSDTDKLPVGLLPFMAITSNMFEARIGKGAVLTPEELVGCPAFVAALARDPHGRGIVCVSNSDPERSPELFARCCDDWRLDPYSSPPVLYAVVVGLCAERGLGNAPADFAETADRDPQLEERVRDWAYAISVQAPEGMEDAFALKAVDWLRRHPGAGTEAGRRRALEGILLLRAHRLEDAERAFNEAGAILGQDEEVQRGLAIRHLAAGNFDRAVTDLGSSAAPLRSLALAASGRIRDAYQALVDQRDSSSDGEAKAATDATAVRIMDRLVLEIESDQIVRNALASEFGRRIQKAAADLKFECQAGWGFRAKSDSVTSAGIESTPQLSMKWGFDYVLPPDPLSLLALLQSIADSAGDSAKPADVEHMATFVKRLSSFVREVVSEDDRK